MMTVVSHSLDLKTIAISTLRDEHDISKFSCGDRDLDKFINKKLKKSHEQNRMKAFCACPRGTRTVYGMYTLSIRSEDAKILLENEQVPEKHFPAIYLGTLAVAKHYQGGGLGTIMLMNALQRSHYVAQNVAVFGVALRSVNDRTTKLYQKYGFGLRETCPNPLMVLPVWSLNDLIERVRGTPARG
jgi:ribosomal protein S18 acetylase RimI-like enzyme